MRKLGATAEQWKEWLGRLEETRHAHLCHDCPALTAAYHCVPFGPLQCCLCAINPITCWHAHRIHTAKERTQDRLNADLMPLGAHFHFMGHAAGEFRRGMPRPKSHGRSRLRQTLEVVAAGALPPGALGQLTSRVAQEEEESQPTPGHVKV